MTHLTQNIKDTVNKSILCWLATVSSDGIPNVSPKEIFSIYDNNKIIVANIASPQTVKNINQNCNVAISCINILVQKGYQLKGKAKIITKQDAQFGKMEKLLLELTQGKFPFSSITAITIEKTKPIIAPKYILYPETTEMEQIEDAKRTYGL